MDSKFKIGDRVTGHACGKSPAQPGLIVKRITFMPQTHYGPPPYFRVYAVEPDGLGSMEGAERFFSPEPAFTLENAPPRERPLAFASSDRTRQGVLFTGLDCLAGQADLFDME